VRILIYVTCEPEIRTNTSLFGYDYEFQAMDMVVLFTTIGLYILAYMYPDCAILCSSPVVAVHIITMAYIVASVLFFMYGVFLYR
jgi:hypothetical protein